MPAFDHNYVEDLIDRLGSIPAGAKPAWGALDRDRLIAHLITTVRYSMGRLGTMPDRGNWFTKRVLAPLIVNGIIPIKKNVKVPGATPRATGRDDLETLHALLEEYLQLVQADELTPPPHPFFGDLGVDGWAKMHLAHFKHHLKQFRA
ncbi:MAG: DUF1569 domain-containing protein [FCB group bacterium]|nr:DUF1569 domain-containing protein [FCB group bacterium]